MWSRSNLLNSLPQFGPHELFVKASRHSDLRPDSTIGRKYQNRNLALWRPSFREPTHTVGLEMTHVRIWRLKNVGGGRKGTAESPSKYLQPEIVAVLGRGCDQEVRVRRVVGSKPGLPSQRLGESPTIITFNSVLSDTACVWSINSKSANLKHEAFKLAITNLLSNFWQGYNGV